MTRESKVMLLRDAGFGWWAGSSLCAGLALGVGLAGCAGDDDDDASDPIVCNGVTCEAGQSCILYDGISGETMETCGIACDPDDGADGGCPDGMTCVVSADGPTQCETER